MKWLVEAKEITHSGEPISRLVSDQEIQKKSAVLRYLSDAKKVVAAAPGILRDLLNGERVQGEWFLMQDDHYAWDTRIVYYFDKYNLKLPDDFIQYVLGEVT